MQILTWHLLRRPTRRSSGRGGPVTTTTTLLTTTSPPLLQRPQAGFGSSLHHHSVPFSVLGFDEDEEGDDDDGMDDQDDIIQFETRTGTMMRTDDQGGGGDEDGGGGDGDDVGAMSTIYYELVEGSDGMVDLHYINHQQQPEEMILGLGQSDIEYSEEQLGGGGDHQQQHHIVLPSSSSHHQYHQHNGMASSSNFNQIYATTTSSSSTTSASTAILVSSSSGVKRKGSSSNSGVSVINSNNNNRTMNGEIIGGCSSNNSSISARVYPSTSRFATSKVRRKRPKLLVNLYEESKGYEVGCLFDDNEEGLPTDDESKMSHMSKLIPYSEDELLQCIDREEVPLRHTLPNPGKHQEVVWNGGQVVAQIRDYRRFVERLKNLGGPNKKPCRVPTIKEVLLRPATQSILRDFNTLVEESVRDRESWLSQRQSLEQPDEEGDSDYEYEVDVDASCGVEANTLTHDQRLELEKEFVNRTGGSVCLDPSPVVGLIANRIQFERLKWNVEKSPSWKRRKEEPEDENAGSEFGPIANLLALDKFIRGVKEKVGVLKDKEPFKLPEVATIDYPILEPPKSFEDILKISGRPPPSGLRPISTENFVKKVEEYILETERRKRPHTTKLSIFQRNGMDCYFGELEMESFMDPPPKPSPAIAMHRPDSNAAASATTKCQFELGSSRSVALYVKQFSDIFTEDGRRPCKITLLKVGQPQPTVYFTTTYNKTAAATTGSPAASGSQITPTTGTSAGGGAGGSSPASAAPTGSASPGQNSSTNATQPQPSPTTPTQPPVQIVHPQPRTNILTVQQQQQPQTVTLIDSSSNNNNANNQQQQQTFTVTAAGTVGQQQQTQQVLTRPQQILSVNVQPGQQQSHQQGIRPQTAAQQQHSLQQRFLRLKQHQLQQQQQLQLQQQQQQNHQQPQLPQTALAKLLLSNIQHGSGNSSRPITVAVQPQPQKTASGTTVEIQQAGPTLTMVSGSTIQTPPAASLQTTSSNLNLNLNNLNTITLDGLLASSASVVSSGGGTTLSSQSGSQGLIQSQRLGGAGGVNILRVNSGSAAGTGLNHGGSSTTTLLQRQLAAGNVSILQSQSGGQRILINANSGQQIGNITLTSGSGASLGPSGNIANATLMGRNHSEGGEDVGGVATSVPDLSSLLGATSTHAQLVHQQPQQQIVDTHNLNLNLNLNLNSSTTETVSMGAHTGQLQGTSQGPPPFLVFISPLRSVPVSIGTTSTAGLAQVRNQAAAAVTQQVTQQQTLNLNLGPSGTSSTTMNVVNSSPRTHQQLMTPPQQQQQQQSHQNQGTVSSANEVASMDGVDSIFNALSEAIGPELGQKLDGMSVANGTSLMIGNTPYTVNVSTSSSISTSEANSSSMSPSTVGSKKDGSVLTLSDLLGSPTQSTPVGGSLASATHDSSSTGGLGTGGSSGTGGIVSSTPRLSALLAGTPSADSSSSLVGGLRPGVGSPLGSPTGGIGGGSLLERLAAGNPMVTSSPGGRTGGSGLNPIATATPNVVLEHPVLAATLTGQQQSPRGVSAYRQIAPAPTAAAAATTTGSSGILQRKH